MKTLARDADKAEVLRRLRAVRKDSARQWGTMSAHQMVCHLSDSCRMLTGELTTKPAATPLPRIVMKWVALYVPLQWPKNISTTPELEQGIGGTQPADFDSDLARLAHLIDRIATDRLPCAGRVHPIFGSMSETDWLRWAYLHADHHLRQFGA